MGCTRIVDGEPDLGRSTGFTECMHARPWWLRQHDARVTLAVGAIPVQVASVNSMGLGMAQQAMLHPSLLGSGTH